MSTRVYLAVKHIHSRSADCLSAKIHFQNAFHLICPRHFHRRPIVKDYHYIFIDFANFPDQIVLTFRKAHMLSVIAFGLKCIRQSCKDYSDFCFFCRTHCLCHKFFINLIFLRVISFRIYNRISCCHLQRRFCLRCIDM